MYCYCLRLWNRRCVLSFKLATPDAEHYRQRLIPHPMPLDPPISEHGGEFGSHSLLCFRQVGTMPMTSLEILNRTDNQRSKFYFFLCAERGQLNPGSRQISDPHPRPRELTLFSTPHLDFIFATGKTRNGHFTQDSRIGSNPVQVQLQLHFLVLADNVIVGRRRAIVRYLRRFDSIYPRNHRAVVWTLVETCHP
jgi:hypothetical protein